MAKFIKIVFLCFFFSVIFPSSVFSLTNGDFESSELSPWETYGGVSATLTTDQSHGGNQSVNIENDSTSSYGIQQVITGIEAGKIYRFSGYIKISDPTVKKALLRIAWYSSSDGSGSQKSTNDSSEVTGVTDWTEINIEKETPSGVASAKVRAVLASNTSGTAAFAYFDDLSFNEAVPSPSPSPSPSPTPTPTSTPKSTPRLTPSPTKTPTSKPSPTPSPTGKILATATSAILGEEETATISGTISGQTTEESEGPEATPPAKQNFLPKILLGGGVLAVLGMIISAFLIQRKKGL